MPVRIVSKKANAPARPAAEQPQAAAAPAAGELPFGLPHPPAGTPQLPAGISLCMIVKNEERFLGACLQSAAPFVDEICIFDTGSTDRTIEIAESFGARVERGEWRNDFAWARNVALEMATRRWIIMLDADEVLRPESHGALRVLRDLPAHLTGLWLRCYSAADDYKGTGYMSNAIVRIYPNSPRIRYRNPIHEFITVDKAATGLDARVSPIAIDHYGYTTEVIVAREKGKRNLEIAKKATETHPEDAFNWSNYGLTAYINGDGETAIAALEKMRELTGNDPRGFIPNSLATLSDVYFECRGDYEKAADVAMACLQRAPHFANAHFMLGKAYSRMRRYEEARQAYEASIEDGKYGHLQFVVDDEIPIWKAHSEIGVTYVHEGNYAKAVEWFDKGLENRPNAQPLLLNRLKALESLERFDEAARGFAALWSKYHDDATAVPYVNYLLRRRQNEMAMTIIDEAVEHVSDDCAASLLMTGAMIANQLQRLDRFESYMQRVLEYQPGNAQALAALEELYSARSEHDKLETLRRQELDAPCFHAADFARRSARLLGEGDVRGARDAAIAGLAKAPDDSSLLYNAAAAEVRLGDRPAALDHLAKVGKENAEIFKVATYLRALLLHEAGRFGEALAAIDDLVAADGTQFDALLLRAKCLHALDRSEEAERVLRMLPQSDPRVCAELGGVLMKLGRYAEALAVVDSALTRA